MQTKADKGEGDQFWLIFCGRPLWMIPKVSNDKDDDDDDQCVVYGKKYLKCLLINKYGSNIHINH